MGHIRCVELPAIWRRIQSNFCKFFLNSVNNMLEVDISRLTANGMRFLKSIEGKSKRLKKQEIKRRGR
jgi:hypothetical protein